MPKLYELPDSIQEAVFVEMMGDDYDLEDESARQEALEEFQSGIVDVETYSLPALTTSDGVAQYCFPTYGWDGGNSVYETPLNLTETDKGFDVFAGPGVALYKKDNASQPAAMLYHYDGESSWLLVYIP